MYVGKHIAHIPANILKIEIISDYNYVYNDHGRYAYIQLSLQNKILNITVIVNSTDYLSLAEILVRSTVR